MLTPEGCVEDSYFVRQPSQFAETFTTFGFGGEPRQAFKVVWVAEYVSEIDDGIITHRRVWRRRA